MTSVDSDERKAQQARKLDPPEPPKGAAPDDAGAAAPKMPPPEDLGDRRPAN